MLSLSSELLNVARFSFSLYFPNVVTALLMKRKDSSDLLFVRGFLASGGLAGGRGHGDPFQGVLSLMPTSSFSSR